MTRQCRPGADHGNSPRQREQLVKVPQAERAQRAQGAETGALAGAERAVGTARSRMGLVRQVKGSFCTGKLKSAGRIWLSS